MLNLQLVLISFLVTIMLYIAITSCVKEYRWHKLKRHITDAIDALNLWNKVNANDIKYNEFLEITWFLDAHKYKHSFYEKGGALLMYCLLCEIRAEHENSNKEN